ncbi:Imm52 family immunity protein [Cystobacter fuscus]
MSFVGRFDLREIRGLRGLAHLRSACARGCASLPPPVRAEPVEDKGTVMVLAPERLSASNPEHLALGRRVQEVLDAKGLLRPVLS